MLCALVLLVAVVGGETVRASYHGFAHTTVGESVLREGLLPENPYHAGSGLGYYTLYPVLGVSIGRLGPGPLWGFVLINALAALLFGPALDALGRGLKLDGPARRAAFWAAVLGFNGLGWIGLVSANGVAWGDSPLSVLRPMTFGLWDPRLEHFLPKWFNATSFAAALPAALWALAAAANRATRPRRFVFPLATALAINPMAGAFAVAGVGIWRAGQLWLGPARDRIELALAGLAAGLLATPFLLPLLQLRPDGPSLLDVTLRGPWPVNLLAPVALLIVAGSVGLRGWPRSVLVRWLALLLLLVIALALLHGRLPFGNEYKFVRLVGLLLALPAGRFAAGWVRRGWPAAAVPLLLALLCLPGTFAVIRAYLAWGAHAPEPALVVSHGRLILDPQIEEPGLPAALLAAEATAPPDAVLLLHPGHPQSRPHLSMGTLQGNLLAPLLHHPLVLDVPQVHNDGQPDLLRRGELSRTFWGTGTPAPASAERGAALDGLRGLLAGRPMLVISHLRLSEIETLLERRGRALSESGGYTLWLLPPVAGTADAETETLQ